MSRASWDHEFAVIGLGAFGASLARRLEAMGHPVLGIDRDAARVQDLADEIADAVVLDATSEDALREISIAAFSTVVVAVSSDFASSALITSSLKEFGIRRVICLATSPRHRTILLRIGADEVVLPYEESGERLAEMLGVPGALAYLALGNDHGLFQVLVPRHLVGKRVDSCERSGISVLLIQRKDELLISPSLSTVLDPGDMLYVVGERQHVTRWAAEE